MGRGYHSNNVARNNEFIWKDQTGGLSLDDKWHCALCKKTLYFEDAWQLTHIKRFNIDYKKDKYHDHRGKKHISGLKVSSLEYFKKEYYDQKNFYGLEIKCPSCNMLEVKMHRLGINYNPLTHNVCIMEGCIHSKKPQKRENFNTASYCKDCSEKFVKTERIEPRIYFTKNFNNSYYQYLKQSKEITIDKRFNSLEKAREFKRKIDLVLEQNRLELKKKINSIKV